MNVLVDFEVLKPCRGLSCSCYTSAWMSWASLRGRRVFCSPSCWQYVTFDLCVKTQFNIFVVP